MLARSIAIASVLSSFTVTQIRCFSSGPRLPLSSLRNSPRSRPPLLTVTVSVSSSSSPLEVDGIETFEPSPSRRSILGRFLGLVLIESYSSASPAFAKCTDIETCREEGERKVEADLKLNPIVRLSDGVRYRVLRSPTSPSSDRVKEGSSIDLAYSISTASGQYMYSKGFGYEKVEFGGRQESDLGLDSMRVVLGKHNVPVGIEYALMGMGKGEKRRVELPPGVGFETSNWQPEPTTRRGKTQIEQYKRKLTGFGSQPPFPAETVWDVEVLAVR